MYSKRSPPTFPAGIELPNISMPSRCGIAPSTGINLLRRYSSILGSACISGISRIPDCTCIFHDLRLNGQRLLVASLGRTGRAQSIHARQMSLTEEGKGALPRPDEGFSCILNLFCRDNTGGEPQPVGP